ncbi:hypothetical protein H5410_053611 [Solanum commersonii]|uniref:Protein kinase domain-containing protein n=1 Tax=Solanum commersonii TaxID=4109 RepID=A0A9J5X7P4_SOLCO|nr:hypothetical protein H5410_053611 [Solanum commersonii]
MKAIICFDVKSPNLLLDKNLRGKVIDFGLSKIGSEIDQTRVGTGLLHKTSAPCISPALQKPFIKAPYV